MDFNFYEIYKNLPTEDLLKIVHRPEGYQPEAVEAASRRLSEREVAPESQAAVQAYYEDNDRTRRSKEEKVNQLKEQAADLLQPIIRPGPDVNPKKWLNIFLLAIGLQFAWTIIHSLFAVYKTVVLIVLGGGFGVHEQIGYKRTAAHLLDFSFLINILSLIYLPLFFYLLYKRKRWGWILVFAEILIGILGLPLQIYTYSRYLGAFGVSYMPVSDMAGFLFQAIVKIAFARFMWRQDICDLFGIGKTTKNKTVLYTSLIVLLGFGVLWLLY